MVFVLASTALARFEFCGTEKTNDWSVGQRRQMTGLWDREDKWMVCGTQKINGWSVGQRRQMNGVWDREDK